MGNLHEVAWPGGSPPAGRGKAYGGQPRARQRTLKTRVQCSGIGLHSGASVTMTLHPAEPDHGIVFRRSDLPGAPTLPALWPHAIETPLCTTLASDDLRVVTIEHLMSALAGTGVDNLLVELDGPEVPVMDGSAAPFVFLVECAGLEVQAAPRRAIRLRRPVEVVEGERATRLLPATQGFSLDFAIAFDSPVVDRQHWSVRLNAATYKQEIARARTFGFLQDVNRLREAGLARGGSLDNAVVIDGEGVMNEGGLRYDNECVRHKVLDSIGDLYLAGAPIIGRYEGTRAGHALNLRLLQALFADSEAWSWVEPTDADLGLAEPGGGAMPSRAVASSA